MNTNTCQVENDSMVFNHQSSGLWVFFNVIVCFHLQGFKLISHMYIISDTMISVTVSKDIFMLL